MKQDWINNTEDGREIYEILDANLPTIEAGGTVTEEQIWNCVNLLLERETKVKNLAQPDVSGSISCDDMEDIIERFYLNHKTGTIENWLIAHPKTKRIICEIMDKRNKKYYR